MTDAGTVAELVARNAASRASHDAVVTHDASVTHGGLDLATRAAAARLAAVGVRSGTRVALLAENGIQWVVAAVAVMRSGAVLVPLSTLLRPPEMVDQLEVAGVDLVVSTGVFRRRDLFAEVSEAAGSVATVRDVLALGEVVAAPASQRPAGQGEDAAPEASVHPGDDMVVLFTSGSRGRPKGVIHTHGGAVSAVAAGLDARRVGPDDRMYIPMPLFWTGGFSVGLFTMLVTGCALLTEAEPEPVRTLELLERERATLFRGWPDQAARLDAHPRRARFDLSALRQASLPGLLDAARRPPPGARPSVLGMTETFGPWCMERLDVDLPPAAWGSCGRPLPGIDMRIVDPGTGSEVPAGRTAEIWLRGEALLRGICGRADSEVFTDDGWFRTGDLGHVDDAGYVFYGGRLDDMFKVSGATVYPSEVEAALRALPGVREAYVTRVEEPDGPRVGALVVGSRSADELASEVRDRLSAFKVPTRWHVTDDPGRVPQGATGKVDIARLAELLASDSSSPGVGDAAGDSDQGEPRTERQTG